ncbi:hypothetical protein CEXT_564741 [Caerostris extrusa]|uniref:Uncharacterized protein n=1 Tax=Caerostris extrusa TaxID=172846 RepID=A0AAV4WLZ8_CAEEX|nr:hypothetical protein CEXT_564741 [Caerostris extrusa]
MTTVPLGSHGKIKTFLQCVFRTSRNPLPIKKLHPVNVFYPLSSFCHPLLPIAFLLGPVYNEAFSLNGKAISCDWLTRGLLKVILLQASINE